jgi:hypothetical protein
MPFRIKNISPFIMTVLGNDIKPTANFDLLTVTNATTIKQSLLDGELYCKIQGRLLTILHPPMDLPYLGLTDSEYNKLAHAGFFQCKLGEDDLKAPFHFNDDGYLLTSANIGSITVESQSEIEGRVADGSSASGIKPVIISGVDNAGNSQSVAVSTDGYVLTQITNSDGSVLDSLVNTAATVLSYIGKPSGSNADFATAYASSTSITCSALPISQINTYDIARILQVTTAGVITIWDRSASVMTCSGTNPTTIVVTGANFSATDSFVVETNIPKLTSYEPLLTADKIIPIRDVSDQYLVEELASATNTGAATVYYPSTAGLMMNGYLNVSFQSVISGGITETFEISNDTLGTNWTDITKSGSDLISNVTGNTSFIDTSSFVCFESLNCYAIRVKIIFADATNSIFIASRKTY